MTKLTRAFPLLLPMAVALLCATVPVSPAHAGMLGFMDETFTFRKDQKPLVEPRRTAVPPKVVVQPFYPNDQHVTWSNFYTRTDLTPQDYLTSSASKVMRPAQQQIEAATTPAQQQGGWNAIAEQAAENAMAEAEAESTSPNILIGDAGDSARLAAGDSQVGRATRIGPAVEDWRNQGTAQIASRPGDFDYRAPAGATVAQIDAPAPVAPEATGGSMVTFTTAPASEDPRYVEQNAKGQVTKYKVQSGDTLGGISGQPAIYGNWKLWPLIYSANRRAIGGSPSNLRNSQRLDIPRDYTEEQARAAERKSGSR